jgi:hypothetical protein
LSGVKPGGYAIFATYCHVLKAVERKARNAAIDVTE